MPIKYDELMALKNLGQKYAYTDREVMLYAYGIGMGADPMDEKELAFVNEAVRHAASAQGGADLRLGRGLGRRARRDESQPRCWWSMASATSPSTSRCRWPRQITADSTRARRLRQGQGQGRGDPAPDRAARTRRASSWRRWSPRALRAAMAASAGLPKASPSRTRCRPARPTDRRYLDAAGPGAGLPALRRPQSAALRSGIRQARRLSAADPARHVHLRHHLPRRAADLCRLRSVAPSGSTPRGSPRRSIPARPSRWICGRTAT